MPKMIDFASGGRWPRLLDPHSQQLGDSSRVSGAQLQCTGAAEWSNKKELIWPVVLDPEMKGAWLDVKRGAGGQLARLQCARGCWVGPQTPLMGGPMLGLEGKNQPACGGWEVKSTALWEVPTVIDVMGGTSHTSGINHLCRPPLGYFFFMKN
ncbi:hypothetical protein C8R44DRAFT_732087 [Mycena epipterygia]|nr:hypothetical protein C8R44DRAFT_732087 [Mycena epipterygia]